MDLNNFKDKYISHSLKNTKIGKGVSAFYNWSNKNKYTLLKLKLLDFAVFWPLYLPAPSVTPPIITLKLQQEISQNLTYEPKSNLEKNYIVSDTTFVDNKISKLEEKIKSCK